MTDAVNPRRGQIRTSGMLGQWQSQLSSGPFLLSADHPLPTDGVLLLLPRNWQSDVCAATHQLVNDSEGADPVRGDTRTHKSFHRLRTTPQSGMSGLPAAGTLYAAGLERATASLHTQHQAHLRGCPAWSVSSCSQDSKDHLQAKLPNPEHTFLTLIPVNNLAP